MKLNYFLCFLSIFFIFVHTDLFAQSGKLRGFVYEEGTDEAVPFANIALKGTSLGAVANEDGYFLINDIPPGSYELSVSFVGYETVSKMIMIKADQITNEKIFLATSNEVLQDVEVTADRQERETKVLTSVVSLSPKQIQQFSVGGDADIIKAIQVLPGVITTGDQGGQIYIRGGAPIQNLILLDGMIVYNPFHSIGFFSVFDADIIQSAEVYSAGFNSEYGSRNSAVMDIQTRDPNRRRFSGKVSASTYMSKVLLETPLGRKNENGQAATSILISAKTSYLDKTSGIFYPYVETEYGELPFSFTDVYSKLTLQSESGSKINFFGFSFDDAVRFGGDNSIGWNSMGGGADFLVVPPASSVLISGDLSYSQYSITSNEANLGISSSGINGFNGSLDFTYFLRENDEFKYGLEAIGYKTNLRLELPNVAAIEQEENTTELGTYFQYKLKAKRLIVEPGIRFHYYGSLSELSIEPRLGFKYNVNDFLRVKGAAGLYSQNLVAANSDRDVVNLFYGFLSGPENVPQEFRGEELDSRLQKARHAILGFEVEVNERLTINLEGYVKDFNQITNINRNKIYDDNVVNNNKPEILKSDYIIEKGLARGVDILAKYRTKDLYLWLTYSLSKVTRDDGIRVYYPQFDRRHNINFVGTYVWGKDRNWEVSTRYNFGSGFPFTPTQAYFVEHPFVNEFGKPSISYEYTRENGQQGTLYGELNSKRLPNYHRLDISIQKTFEITDNQNLEVSLGATNILNYENIFYFDREDVERVNQLPVMPTMSLQYSF